MIDKMPCLSFCGIYKKGLRSEEKDRFRRLLKLNDTVVHSNGSYSLDGESYLVIGRRKVYSHLLDDQCDPLSSVFLMINSNSIDQSCNNAANCDDDFGMQLDGLNGSWAACLINEAAGKVYLARDPAGAQSVYFGYFGEAFLFASSLSFFQGFGLELDKDAIVRLLHFLYVPPPRTIYQGISALMSGESVMYDGRRVEYRNPTGFGSDSYSSQSVLYSDAVNQYENLLAQAARNNAGTSGKIGLFLSGGKDSSTLAIAAKLAGLTNIEAITLGFSDKAIDEGDDARCVADHLGIPFRLLVFSDQEYLRLWPSLIRSLGQPMGDFAVLPVFAAIQKLKDEFDMFWDGTGTDLAFGIPASFQEKIGWRLNKYFPVLRLFPWNKLPKGYSYTMDKIALAMNRTPEEQFVSWSGWSVDEVVRLTGVSPDLSDSALYQKYPSCSTAMDHKTYTICNTWSPETCYRKMIESANYEDRIVRYPFLDKDLIRFTRNLPESLKIQGNKNKVLLREVMARHLPENILNKPKGSFNIQKHFILKSNRFEMLQTYLSDSVVKRHGLLEPGIINKYVKEYMKGNEALEDRIWIVLMLHTWLEQKSGGTI